MEYVESAENIAPVTTSEPVKATDAPQPEGAAQTESEKTEISATVEDTPATDETVDGGQTVEPTAGTVADDKKPVQLSRDEKIEQLLAVLTNGVREILEVERRREQYRQKIIDESLMHMHHTLTTMVTTLATVVNEMQNNMDYTHHSLYELENEKPYTDELRT